MLDHAEDASALIGRLRLLQDFFGSRHLLLRRSLLDLDPGLELGNCPLSPLLALKLISYHLHDFYVLISVTENAHAAEATVFLVLHRESQRLDHGKAFLSHSIIKIEHVAFRYLLHSLL